MCSIDCGLWCWDATNQAACHDAPSQRRGWRGVLSFSLEVGVRQGRVTLPCKALRGESVGLTRTPHFEVFVRILYVYYTIYLPSRGPHSKGKNHQCLHLHRWKTFLMLLNPSRARHLWAFLMKPLHLFLRVHHTFGWLTSIRILPRSLSTLQNPYLFQRFITSPNLLPV